MKTFVRNAKLETRIEVPFKALCPIPDPPRYYHAVLILRYTSCKVFDYNEVAARIHSFCASASRSVEDVVFFGMSLILGHLGDVFALCKVEVPQQEGHLHVIVSLYSQEYKK